MSPGVTSLLHRKLDRLGFTKSSQLCFQRFNFFVRRSQFCRVFGFASFPPLSIQRALQRGDCSIDLIGAGRKRSVLDRAQVHSRSQIPRTHFRHR